MKKSLTALAAAICLLFAAGCHEIEEYPHPSMGNFDQLLQLFDEHYCFFEEKGVDWDSIYAQYRPRALNCRSTQELFGVCSDMLSELRDGHVNLSSWFNTFYYRAWWSDYPQNFNERVLQENYLYFNYDQLGPITFAILPSNIGYIRISSFDSGIGEGNMNAILAKLIRTRGLIIDIRDNGGGSMTNIETIARRFMHGRTLAYSIRHKDGKGHNDFSEPYDVYFEPQADFLLWLNKPVALLTNRSTFSAANVFAAVLKECPQVTVIGARTGGGGGMPLSYELPFGWGVRMSAAPIHDARGNCIENGVDPTPGYEVNFTDEDSAAGRDPILDTAVNFIETNGF